MCIICTHQYIRSCKFSRYCTNDWQKTANRLCFLQQRQAIFVNENDWGLSNGLMQRGISKQHFCAMFCGKPSYTRHAALETNFNGHECVVWTAWQEKAAREAYALVPPIGTCSLKSCCTWDEVIFQNIKAIYSFRRCVFVCRLLQNNLAAELLGKMGSRVWSNPHEPPQPTSLHWYDVGSTSWQVHASFQGQLQSRNQSSGHLCSWRKVNASCVKNSNQYRLHGICMECSQQHADGDFTQKGLLTRLCILYWRKSAWGRENYSSWPFWWVLVDCWSSISKAVAIVYIKHTLITEIEQKVYSLTDQR